MGDLPSDAELRAGLRDRISDLSASLEASEARNRELEGQNAMKTDVLTDLAALLKRDFHLDKATHDAICKAIEDDSESFILRVKAEAKAECLDRVLATMVRDMTRADISKLTDLYRVEAKSLQGGSAKWQKR